jgi:uncharacterized membrane protein YbhN (UPF0104 family)
MGQIAALVLPIPGGIGVFEAVVLLLFTVLRLLWRYSPDPARATG